jgi:hypothetical protein
MLGTDRLRTVPIGLVVESREWVTYLNELFPILTNYVDVRNQPAIDWLEALGFIMSDMDMYRTGDTIFRRFFRCAQQQEDRQGPAAD